MKIKMSVLLTVLNVQKGMGGTQIEAQYLQ